MITLETTCACRPGTEATGWMEQRCAQCIADELAIWGAMMKRWREERSR